jgi:GNAT superfamily N-acetyltransferase
MSRADAVIAPLAVGDVDRLVDVVEAALPSRRPEPGDARRARIGRRLRGTLASDPDGAWVAREGGEPVGIALAVRSAGIWVLSLLAVSPHAQSGGLGRALLVNALRSADSCRGAMIAASWDPRALRVYFRAGFDLRPTVAASGAVDRSAIPTGLDALVSEAGVDDVERTVAVDEVVRGGGRPAHLAALLDAPGVRLYLAGERGYALASDGGVLGVAALDEEAARALLWRALADVAERPAAADDARRAGEGAGAGARRADGRHVEAAANGPATASIERIAAGQDWAVDVALSAGLSLHADGPIFTRGTLGTLQPFLPTGAYL